MSRKVLINIDQQSSDFRDIKDFFSEKLICNYLLLNYHLQTKEASS